MLAEVDEFLDETLTEIGQVEMSHNRVDSVEYAEAFERKMITARELGHLEEKYYQHQLSNCL